MTSSPNVRPAGARVTSPMAGVPADLTEQRGEPMAGSPLCDAEGRHAWVWTWPIEGGEGSIGQCSLCGRITTAERDAAARAEVAALRSAVERTERNFRLAVHGKPVRDMAENLAENAAALAASVGSSGEAESGPDERDDHERGLYGKYRVERISDPMGKHADCRYFVLDPQHDPHAVAALRAYADACAADYPALAGDLRAWAAVPTPAPVSSGGQADGESEQVKRAIRTLLPGLRVANYSERWAAASPAVRALTILCEYVGQPVDTAGDLVDPHMPTMHDRPLAARPVLSREALRDRIAQALHAWDVEGGPCEGPWDGLTDHQREVWLSGADAVLDVLAGGEQA